LKYREIADGIFVDRPNRFIAHVEVNGAVETVHVKNTGRCISVQQIVRSDIQAGRKILQQLNRAAAASRFNFCKMVRTNIQHYTQLFLCNPLLFPQIADTSAEFFCIKSHCSILSFAPKTQTGRGSFSESRPVFSLKMHNDRGSMELLL
jgi:hypothetical protein